MTADSGIHKITRACILGIVLLTSLNITGLHAELIYRTGILQSHDEAPSFITSLGNSSVDFTVVTYGNLLADGSCLGQFDCLLIPHSPDFPQAAFADIKRFIESGRDLILLGGQAFTRPLWRFQDQWLTREELRVQTQQTLVGPRVLIEPNSPAAEWKRHALNLATPSRIISEDGQFNLEIRDIDLWAWDAFAHPFPDEVPAEHNTLAFELKASPPTRSVVIEVIEKDKSRWVYVAPASPEWKKHNIWVGDFQFFADGSPPHRGFIGDKLNLANGKDISVGLAFTFSPFTAGSHDISIRQIATGQTDLPAGFTESVLPMALPVFENRDIYRFKEITDISACQEQDLLVDIPDINGDFVGLSAVGFAYSDASHFVPLLCARDGYCRIQGLAAGLLVHYDGPYAPGQWFISGVETPAFYQSQTFIRTLGQIIDHLKNKNLPSRYQKQNNAAKSRKIATHADADRKDKSRPLRISPDGRHFITADHRRFFAIGSNYLGPRDRKCQLGGPLFDAVKIEADFRAAQKAGINLFRFWPPAIEDDHSDFQTILALAEKYRIYLLLLPVPHAQPSDKETLAALQTYVRLAADCPMVMGYDLMNEPMLTDIGAIRINNQSSPIIQHNTYERYDPDLFNRLWVDQLAQNRSGWPAVKPWVDDDNARELLAAHFLGEKLLQQQLTCGNMSLLCGLEKELRLPPEYQEFQQALNQTFANWIHFQTDALKKMAPGQHLTIGYNSPLVALAANQTLDFQAYHLYNLPYSRRDFEQSLSTLDRLRDIFPHQPITLGEFGYSSGLQLPDGEYLDIHSAGIAEMMTMLYAYAHDYSGVMFWLLTEWPVANIAYNAPWIPPDKYVHESRLGMYYHDGTEQPHPKPIAYAAAFFREYLDTQPAGPCEFTLTEASIPIKTGYVFRGPDALFIGNQAYHSEAISFKARQPANVMVRWDRQSLYLMATADASVIVNPALITKRSVKQPLKAIGNYADLRQIEKEISINLLAGETVSILLVKTTPEENSSNET